MEYRNRIRKNLVYLTESTSNLVVLTIHLIQHGVITRAERDIIMGKETFVSQCDILYHILSQKLTETSFSYLLEALTESGNEHVVKVLGQENNFKIMELAVKLHQLTECEITELNEEMETIGGAKKESMIFVLNQSKCMNALQTCKNEVFPKHPIPTSVRNCWAQTEETAFEANEYISLNLKQSIPHSQQYIFHDTTLRRNPFLVPTAVKELILYHVKISGSELRKLFRSTRGLETFKWLSFSQDSEFALRDFDALVDSKLTDLTFKCVNLEFDEETFPNMSGLSHLRLWMCKCQENLVEILNKTFPNLESIEFRGVKFGSGGGLKGTDVKSLLQIPNLKKLYIGPWTYPAFRTKVENDLELTEVFDQVGAPMHTWSPLFERDTNYKWAYIGEECE